MPTNKGQYSFFAIESQLDKIYQINNFLPKLNAIVDWETILGFSHQENRLLHYCLYDYGSDNARYRSASRAAMQPVPAAEIA